MILPQTLGWLETCVTVLEAVIKIILILDSVYTDVLEALLLQIFT